MNSMIIARNIITELKLTTIKRGIELDYNKYKNRDEKRKRKKVRKALVKYINETSLLAIDISKLRDILEG